MKIGQKVNTCRGPGTVIGFEVRVPWSKDNNTGLETVTDHDVDWDWIPSEEESYRSPFLLRIGVHMDDIEKAAYKCGSIFPEGNMWFFKLDKVEVLDAI